MFWMKPNKTDLVTLLPNQPEGKSRGEREEGRELREKQACLIYMSANKRQQKNMEASNFLTEANVTVLCV